MNLPLHLAREANDPLPSPRTRLLFTRPGGRISDENSLFDSPVKRCGDASGHANDPGGGTATKVAHWTLTRISSQWILLMVVGVPSYLLGRIHSPRNTSNLKQQRMQTLQKRQDVIPSCNTGGVSSEDYDLPLHVAAVFIVFAVSGSACVFPILAVRFPKIRVPAGFLFVVQHLGTGVLLATAFVHLLPTAFIALLNPCLESFWNETYPAMPGAIALAGIFIVTIIEMVFSPGRYLCREHASAGMDDNGNQETRDSADQTSGRPFQSRHLVGGRSSSIGRELTRSGIENQELEVVDQGRTSTVAKDPDTNTATHPALDCISTPEQQKKKAVMQCTLLEVGILFHSIFIGMSLSVTIGSEFIVLLIAIIFHQSCEGLALGARIARIHWGHRPIQPWLMALAYGCTTPLGQVIGLATHRLYSPDSEVGLLIVGIFDAISAGFLTFNSLIELLSEDFLSDDSWKVLRGKQRYIAFALVFVGAFGMSLIGAWA